MAKISKTIRFVTPVGVAVYPKISEPDTKGKYADGKYKTDVDFGDHTDALIKKFEDAAKAWGAPMNLPVVEQKDKDKKPTGKRLIRFKSKYRPAVFDAKKNPLPENMVIGGGSEIRIDCTLFPYTEGKGGVALRLGPVQVANLVEGGEGAANFDEMEGFTYDDDSVKGLDGSEGFEDL
jgi:hypothetical protein